MYLMYSHAEDIARRFYEFSQLSASDQLLMLAAYGVLLDTDREDGKVIRLYFLHGFFVEQVENTSGEVLELIPYKNGYRLYNFLLS